MRAVIFDLWDTLVAWPVAEGERLKRGVAAHLDLDEDEFDRRWRESYRASQTRPLAEVYRELGVPDEHLEAEVEACHEFGRRALRLRDGARAPLLELRSRGLPLGLISVCSEEVPAAWPDSDLAGLFDVETFSADCGLVKPEPEIYLRTAEALGVDPADCLFVGDGANDELAGAERVGMTSALYLPNGDEPMWSWVKEWAGLRASSVEDVLALC
jgi:putative hydrolase of the HAD superfamily